MTPPRSLLVACLVATGIAVGYVGGNVFPFHPHRHSERGPGDEGIPDDWLVERDMGAEEAFAGLTAEQRLLALRVLNTKPCDCGCSHGSIAECKVEDPSCPIAGTEIQMATRAARDGKSFDEIYQAVHRPH
jgi:hypothetical protein